MKIVFFFIVNLLILSSIDDASSIDANVTVNNLGTIIGKLEKSKWSERVYYSFRGIPYAEPPIGELRYAPPLKITSWPNNRMDGTTFKNICPQTKQPGYDVESYDEDCLHLNVYVPKTNSKRRLPIMIWIHGGYFMSGHARRYDANYLMESDVILVVPQFRLGPLGLLCLETEDIPGNVQFLDQIIAMEWVKDNIECFGGDVNSVTLFGQSSGGYSVNLHLLSPLSRGLFHRTIIQSNSIYTPAMMDKNPINTAKQISMRLGCDVENIEDMTKCLKTIDVETILKGFDEYIAENSMNGGDNWGGNRLVVQKFPTNGRIKFLTEEPSVLMERGEFLKLPMIGGTTREDGSLLVSGLYDALNETDLLSDKNFLNNELLPLALKSIGVNDDTGAMFNLLTEKYFPDEVYDNFLKMVPGLTYIGNLLIFKSGINRMLYKNSKFQPTYLYSFHYRGNETRFGYESDKKYPFDGGVSHSDDNIYLFPYPDKLNNEETSVAKNLIQLWTNFAIYGYPYSENVKNWRKLETTNGPYLIISSESVIKNNYTDEYFKTKITIDTDEKSIKSCAAKIIYIFSTIVVASLISLNIVN